MHTLKHRPICTHVPTHMLNHASHLFSQIKTSTHSRKRTHICTHVPTHMLNHTKTQAQAHTHTHTCYNQTQVLPHARTHTHTLSLPDTWLLFHTLSFSNKWSQFKLGGSWDDAVKAGKKTSVLPEKLHLWGPWLSGSSCSESLIAVIHYKVSHH